MANRWKGNFVVATAATSDGTAYTGKANGAWSLNSQLQQKQANLWAAATGVPGSPTAVTASAGDTNATISFTAPSNTGGLPITGYTATSSPGGITGTASSSPITVTGLTNGTAYTFTVAAINAAGTGTPSSASNSVTPVGITQSVIMGMSATPYLASYQWKAGFQTKNTAPTTTPQGLVYDLVYIQGNAGISGAVAASSFTAPCLDVYSYTSVGGFGTRYANPATLPDFGYAIAYNSTNSTLVVQTAATPFVYAYPFTIAGGIGTKYANPSTLPTAPSGGKGIGFKSDGTVLAMITSTTPWIIAYNWSSGFGTKVANSSALSSNGPNAMSWNSTGTLIAVASNGATNAVQTVAWNSGFGTITSNAASTSGMRSINFNTTNQYIVGTGSSLYGYINTYPSSLSSSVNTNNGIDTKDGAFSILNAQESVAFALGSSPYISAYQFNSGAISTKYSDPSTLPEADGYSIVFAY